MLSICRGNFKENVATVVREVDRHESPPDKAPLHQSHARIFQTTVLRSLNSASEFMWVAGNRGGRSVPPNSMRVRAFAARGDDRTRPPDRSDPDDELGAGGARSVFCLRRPSRYQVRAMPFPAGPGGVMPVNRTNAVTPTAIAPITAKIVCQVADGIAMCAIP